MRDSVPACDLGEDRVKGRPFLLAALHAVPVSPVVLGLFYDWFAIADRYVLFLYGHYGALPFDERTRSRYWMSGLVTVGVEGPLL